MRTARGQVDMDDAPLPGDASAFQCESDDAHQNYLDRCQVDTPADIIKFVWEQVNLRRPNAGAVVDFGCGDARFSSMGRFDSYHGFEIDPERAPSEPLGNNASVEVGCAFEAAKPSTYQTCIGNPPFVRHHDLTAAWRTRINNSLLQLEGYTPDGRANAYIYFMWLALMSVQETGLVALVVPYDWVSRPASSKLRDYIKENGWSVDVYFLSDTTFNRVLTTACVTIIDKSVKGGTVSLYDLRDDGAIIQLKQPTKTRQKRLSYERADNRSVAHASRGLSPGDQPAFVLTEKERVLHHLRPGVDVVPAVTSFRKLDETQNALTERLFQNKFVNQGRRCWLINTDGDPSDRLLRYLETVPQSIRTNYTCRIRETWWKFRMPATCSILYASGFTMKRPKVFLNQIGAVHVGGIHGIECDTAVTARAIFDAFRKATFSTKVVSLSHGFMKVEVNQMNAYLNALLKKIAGDGPGSF